jgi:hypothetical protein
VCHFYGRSPEQLEHISCSHAEDPFNSSDQLPHAITHAAEPLGDIDCRRGPIADVAQLRRNRAVVADDDQQVVIGPETLVTRLRQEVGPQLLPRVVARADAQLGLNPVAMAIGEPQNNAST